MTSWFDIQPTNHDPTATERVGVGCSTCWKERGVFEELISCVNGDGDGPQGWYWWCRTCKVMTGYGYFGGTLDLDAVRRTPNPDNDFTVFA